MQVLELDLLPNRYRLINIETRKTCEQVNKLKRKTAGKMEYRKVSK